MASDHLYKIDFKDIHLNLLTGSATLDSVTLVAGYGRLSGLKKETILRLLIYWI